MFKLSYIEMLQLFWVQCKPTIKPTSPSKHKAPQIKDATLKTLVQIPQAFALT